MTAVPGLVMLPLRIMNEDVRLQRLSDGYWKHYRLSTGSRQERLDADQWVWAWDEVEGAVMKASSNTFEILMALVESAPDDGEGTDVTAPEEPSDGSAAQNPGGA